MARATITTPGTIITTTQDLSRGGSVFATAHTTAGVLEWPMSTGRSRSTTDTGDTLTMDGGGHPGTDRPIIARPIIVLPMSGHPYTTHRATSHPGQSRPARVRLVRDRPTDVLPSSPATATFMTNEPTG